ncbi:hypothetical protein ACFSTD_20495 [Novosphingobium colocasiae]
MSVESIRIMSRRRQFARPGGSHDRLVAFLAKALPAGIGVMVAVMVLAPPVSARRSQLPSRSQQGGDHP